MRRTIFIFAGFALLGCSSVDPSRATQNEADPVPAVALKEDPPKKEEKQIVTDERALRLGHKKFMEGCAKCHDERGDKVLENGEILNEMQFTESVLAEKVGHRAHDYSPEEQKAILLYVRSILIHPPTPDDTSKPGS